MEGMLEEEVEEAMAAEAMEVEAVAMVEEATVAAVEEEAMAVEAAVEVVGTRTADLAGAAMIGAEAMAVGATIVVMSMAASLAAAERERGEKAHCKMGIGSVGQAAGIMRGGADETEASSCVVGSRWVCGVVCLSVCVVWF